MLRTATLGDSSGGGATTTSSTTTTIVGGTVATPPQLLVTTTSREIHHTGIDVNVVDLGTESIPDDGTLAANYGDIVGCDHAPLFS